MNLGIKADQVDDYTYYPFRKSDVSSPPIILFNCSLGAFTCYQVQ